MGLWIHAVCQKSIANALGAVDTFFDSLDFQELEIELGGISGFDPECIRNQLLVETGSPLSPPFDTAWCAISYGHGAHDGFSLDRIVDSETVTKTTDELTDCVPPQISDGSRERINNVARQACELISTRLPASCISTLCGPLARETMIWLASRGDGLAVLDGKWFDPTQQQWLE